MLRRKLNKSWERKRETEREREGRDLNTHNCVWWLLSCVSYAQKNCPQKEHCFINIHVQKTACLLCLTALWKKRILWKLNCVSDILNQTKALCVVQYGVVAFWKWYMSNTHLKINQKKREKTNIYQNLKQYTNKWQENKQNKQTNKQTKSAAGSMFSLSLSLLLSCLHPTYQRMSFYLEECASFMFGFN